MHCVRITANDITTRLANTDEIECPLLEITHVIFLRRLSSILKAVSVVQILPSKIPRLVERETIATSRIEYEQDLKTVYYIV